MVSGCEYFSLLWCSVLILILPLIFPSWGNRNNCVLLGKCHISFSALLQTFFDSYINLILFGVIIHKSNVKKMICFSFLIWFIFKITFEGCHICRKCHLKIGHTFLLLINTSLNDYFLHARHHAMCFSSVSSLIFPVSLWARHSHYPLSRRRHLRFRKELKWGQLASMGKEWDSFLCLSDFNGEHKIFRLPLFFPKKHSQQKFPNHSFIFTPTSRMSLCLTLSLPPSAVTIEGWWEQGMDRTQCWDCNYDDDMASVF